MRFFVFIWVIILIYNLIMSGYYLTHGYWSGLLFLPLAAFSAFKIKDTFKYWSKK